METEAYRNERASNVLVILEGTISKASQDSIFSLLQIQGKHPLSSLPILQQVFLILKLPYNFFGTNYPILNCYQKPIIFTI